MAGYRELYERSLRDPEGFWGEEAEAIAWHRRWDRVLDDSEAPFYRWFAGGELNTAYNCLDRHADGGRGEQPALIHDSPVTGTQTVYTYAELRDAVARFAGVLRGLGVGHGDRVIVYMPMIPEAAIAMLACARIGAVHSVVFGGFAGAQLAKRISFRVAPGFGERVIFRELFPKGLTLLDLRESGTGVNMTMSHMAARQEVRALLADIGHGTEAALSAAE